jgi:hypothetical protein
MTDVDASKAPTIGDLAMLVARLVHQVRRFDADNPTAAAAMDYLRRKDIAGSVLREITSKGGVK